MVDIVKDNTGKKFLISKNNIVVEVNSDLLGLIGYAQNELVGRTLMGAGKILRIDSQVNLQDIEDLHKAYIFTSGGLAIDVTITCKSVIKGNIKIYYFKENSQIFLRNMLLNFNDLSISKKQALVIYSYPDCICLKTNEKYMSSLNSINSTSDDPVGKPYQYPRYLSKLIEEGGSFYEDEMELIGSDGIATYWDISMKGITGDENKTYLMFSLYDVSDRVIERKLQDKKTIEMELILKSISDVITIVNNKGDFIYANKAGVDKFSPYGADIESLDVKERFGLFMFRDIEGNKLPHEDTPVQRVLRGEGINSEVFVGTSHLPTTYHECIGIPVYDDLGNIDGGILTYRDIGDRIKAEEERLLKKEKELKIEILEAKILKEGKGRLSKIMESQELEFIRCTYPSLDIISINGNVLNGLKKTNNGIKSLDSIIGESYTTIYPIYKDAKKREWKLYLNEKEDYSHIDYTDHIIDGKKRFFKTINQPMFGLNNTITEVIFITTDITEEVKANNKMEDTLEMQNQLFSTISHELKTPLSVIYSATQLIEIYLKKEINEINRENINKNISVIKQNCYRFTKLINNIIDLSSIESGFYKLNCGNRNIIETVENVIDSVRGYVEDKGLSIIFDTEIEEKIIAVDVDKMERILLNLISNAVKFSFKNGNIYIDIKEKKDFVEILVRDSGIGISKKHLNTIFDKYKRVDNSLVRNAEGSGIGLALVKTMVGIMHGEINVESELGKGSLFTVRLPVKILDESETVNDIEYLDNRVEQINIEFSDVYSK